MPLTSEVAEVAQVADTAQVVACTMCGQPLDQALIAAGFTDHGQSYTGRAIDIPDDELGLITKPARHQGRSPIDDGEREHDCAAASGRAGKPR